MGLWIALRPPRWMRLLLTAFAPRTVLLQLSVLVCLLQLRSLLPRVSAAALHPPLGAAMDVVFAAAAVMTVDPMASDFYLPRHEALPPALAPHRFRRRLARIAAFLRWLVYVPSACRAALLWSVAAARPRDPQALPHALAAFLTTLRMLQLD